MSLLLTAVIVIAILTPTIVLGANLTDAENLKSVLFTSYDKELRPRYDQSVNVSIMYFIFSIAAFDEKEGVLTSVGGINAAWADSRLSWDPNSYGNLSSLQLPSSKTWYPDIYCVNPADEMEEIGGSSFITTISASGLVSRLLGTIFKTSCAVDITHFPFDTQVCRIKLSAWGYDSSTVRLVVFAKDAVMEFYTENSAWKLMKTEVISISMGSYDNVVAVDLTLKRMPEYFVLNVLAPIVLLTLLTPLVFTLPVGERVGFTITLFLSFAVCLTLLSDNMPKSSSPMSRMSFFLAVTIIFATLLIVLNILLLKLNNRESESTSTPKWLTRLIFVLRLGCFRCGKKKTVNNNVIHVSRKGLPENVENTQEDKQEKVEQDDMGWTEALLTLDKLLLIYSYIFLLIYFLALIIALSV